MGYMKGELGVAQPIYRLGYRQECRGSIPGREGILLFAIASRPALGPN